MRKNWVKGVYSRPAQWGQSRGLSAGALGTKVGVGYKSYALHTNTSCFTRPVLPSKICRAHAVIVRLLPTIHTANKNNDNVNYFKNYSLLIRSPA
jgi:hypothetical protein